MRRYIVLLLITGIVWAQTDFDTLVLKDGTTYFGEYSKIEEKIVYFKHQDAFGFQPVPVKLIQTLQLKDGQFIILDGKDILTYEEYQKNSLEEYQKLSTKEKAIYDAAGDAKKWLFYPPTTVLTLAASSGSYFVVTGHHPLESITASIISVFGLVVPYYGFKYLDKNQDVEISPEDIQRYKRIYSEEFKKRKSKNIVKGFGLLGLTAAAGYCFFLATFSLSGDFSFGP
ncbi:MAG: hypothetical protein HOK52_05045 [Candidatus Marinimicrobia bacterium]|jgi:hypothetical protein|nr:hypothetical protein [Candidatus Neomarinimicrobiota bacterium]MBT3937901.1 hypothetical protein [Candidatus Neomarinimicrobiota bacterium]MBT3961045.1 hypothetical protein [Candidatus Neomarinimicrobiota bacterium]MBT4383141.1 hypothetical protein [Candidatus Neomarinimicrobiota bacterium]MBT4635945.1 hypothetical protein [Candidatus Neomarinimicrobiota bacterium]